ncbi:hypothetical protein [Streptomyces silvisoli]|uniref:Uncharacterized protein n=1 Tax=Streptomyces silvisoli TaxID=3034235 RepID=A0ABT5ZJQ3_9ACTN|nr:hypothetical protein [Streptomyces silvisoli]MDF3289809.1 hypothetical protein [Streptomyces silvisoli]
MRRTPRQQPSPTAARSRRTAAPEDPDQRAAREHGQPEDRKPTTAPPAAESTGEDDSSFSPGYTSPGFSSPGFDGPQTPAGPRIGESETGKRMRAEQQGEDAITPRPLPERHKPPQPPRPNS